MRSLGDYELITRLGSGTTAEVFLGRPRPGLAADAGPSPGLLAVKTIRPELAATPGYLAAIARERPAALALRHPNAVRIDAIDVVDGGGVLFAMEPIFGQTFAQVLHLASLTRTPVSPELWLHVAREVARVLESSDRLGVGERLLMRHGALSPHAILITYDGAVRVLGVGIGRSRGLLPTALHTLAYRAPEVFEGATFDGPTDIYSLGVTLYDALSGGRVFRRRTAAETRAAILDPGSPPPLHATHERAPDVVALVASMMSRKRSERPDGWRRVGARLDEEIRTDRAELTAILESLMGRWFEDDQRASRRLVEASMRARAASNLPVASSRPTSSSRGPVAARPSSSSSLTAPSVPFSRTFDVAPFDPDEGVDTASLPEAPADAPAHPQASNRVTLEPLPPSFAERRTLTAEEIRALALDLLQRLSTPPESHDLPTAGRSTSAADAPDDRT